LTRRKVEAQTVQRASGDEQKLAIIPVINKIDLPHADVAQTKQQLEDILAIPPRARFWPRKEGMALTRSRGHCRADSAPAKPERRPLQALGFDSYFDTYKGVVTHVRVFNGELKRAFSEIVALGKKRRG